jgi:outer membrane immunogenic protein
MKSSYFLSSQEKASSQKKISSQEKASSQTSDSFFPLTRKPFASLSLWLLVFLSFSLNQAYGNSSKRLSEDVEALGGNTSLLELSKELNPDKKVRVVQNRLVPRENRFEITTGYGQKLGGDAYLQTQAFHFNVEYHLNPKFSFGLIYYNYGNRLSNEGQRIFKEADEALKAGGGISSYPNIDPPQHSLLGQMQFYPIYGKINIFDKTIIQFDVSLIAAVGSIQLESGRTAMVSAGIGSGFWINQNISLRLELRHETYKDQDFIYKTHRTLNPVHGSIGLGFML